ncbi:MAG: ABC transporter substrate-binding protein [Elusimicrobia bacterium]|nr:ABC transporter substrate-binding protein [Elusimicrobiota bacterium]
MTGALLAFALLLPAARPAAASSTSTFVSALAGPITNLDPAAIYDNRSLTTALSVYEPLIIFSTDPDKEPFAPYIASAVPTRENGLLSRDERVYTFPIRPGMLFHGGSTVTADDVRYSLLRWMLSDFTGGTSAMLLEPILGVPSTRDRKGRLQVDFKKAAAAVAVEGDNVVVRLQRPDSSFLAILASWPLVVPKAWAAAKGEWDGSEAGWLRYNGRLPDQSRIRFVANGTGPFRLAEPTSKELVTLVRFDAYWRRKPAALERVILREVDSEMTRLSMLEAGDADYAELSRSSLRDAAEAPGVRVEDGLPLWSVGQAIFFNFRAAAAGNPSLRSGRLDGKGVPPDFFSDPHVRLGFARAFDYEAYLSQALRGHGERAAGPIPFALFSRKPPQPAYSHDPALAAEHLKAAWHGRLWKRGFQAEIGYDEANPEALAAAEILAASLKAIKPEFQLNPKPLRKEALFKALRQHTLPIFVGGFEADYPDPHSFAFNLLHSAGFYPMAQSFSDKAMDSVVERARRDGKHREELYRRLMDLYAAKLPQIYLYYPVGFRALRSNVSENTNDNWLGSFTLHNAIYYRRVRKD